MPKLAEALHVDCDCEREKTGAAGTSGKWSSFSGTRVVKGKSPMLQRLAYPGSLTVQLVSGNGYF